MGGLGCVLIKQFNIANASDRSRLLHREAQMARSQELNRARVFIGYTDQRTTVVRHDRVGVNTAARRDNREDPAMLGPTYVSSLWCRSSAKIALVNIEVPFSA